MAYTPDNKFNGQENGFVTITYPDGTKEKYNPQGQKVHIIKKEEVKYFFFF